MPRIEKCGKCGSTAIVQRAMIADRSDSGETDLQLRVDARPSAVVLKKSVHGTLHAFVCSSCGYVELYVDHPGELYRAFVAAQEDSLKHG